MDLLEKRITGDWIEVREKLNTPVRMKAYLKLEDARLGSVPDDLRAATMGGLVEFKKRLAGSVFNFLTRLSFTTPNQTEILGAEADIRLLIYVLCLETQFATGQLKPAKEAEGPLAGSNPRNRPPVEEIVSEVKARVSANPDLAKNPHVKNIFMEIQLYQKEFGQFATLSPQIPDDRAPTFFMNYKKRLDGILDNIHGHFRDIRMAEDDEMRKEFQRQEEDQFAVPELVKLVSTQAQELTKVRSSIFHALQEGYQIRNLLLKLTERKDPFFALLEEELTLLDTRQDPAANGHPAAVKLARSLASVLEGNRKG
jgi:hypothetical protein